MFNLWLGKGQSKEKEKPKVDEKSRLDMNKSKKGILEIVIALVAVALFIASMSWIVN